MYRCTYGMIFQLPVIFAEHLFSIMVEFFIELKMHEHGIPLACYEI
jgi:hypothetical protein